MFNLEIADISRAIENAKALHPKVRMVRFGEYEVTGSKGGNYTVRCFRENGRKFVVCGCLTRDGIACKHGMAAVALHIAMAERRGRSN